MSVGPFGSTSIVPALGQRDRLRIAFGGLCARYQRIKCSDERGMVLKGWQHCKTRALYVTWMRPTDEERRKTHERRQYLACDATIRLSAAGALLGALALVWSGHTLFCGLLALVQTLIIIAQLTMLGWLALTWRRK